MDNLISNNIEEETNSKRRNLGKKWKILFTVLVLSGIALAVMQVFLIHPVLSNSYLYFLLAFFLSPVFLFYPVSSKAPKNRVPWYDILIFLFVLIFCGFLGFKAWDITHQGWAFLAPKYVDILSIILCVIILEGVRRSSGTALFIVTTFFAIFPIFSSFLPGILKGSPYAFDEVMRYHVLSNQSMIGVPTQVVGSLVLGFMLFGQALVSTGGGKFFLDFAFAVVGNKKGGPAKVSIIASGLFGSLSGSPISNVIATGSITIPTMKKCGYPAHYAAAVESCASTGGNIMPPVMGAASFILASFVGVPYLNVIAAALFPALLYYLGIYFQIDLYSRKVDLKGLDEKHIPHLGTTLKEGFPFIFAFIVLFVLLFYRKESQAPFYSTICLLAYSIIRKSNRMNFRKVVEFIQDSGHVISQLLAILAGCGFVLGAFSLTGLASSFSREIIMFAGDNAFLILLFGAFTAFILGMGLTVSACYIFLSIILVPAMISAGNFNILAANLFVLYWSIVSWITPPVALSSYTAAGIAGASPMKTGLQSMKLAIVIYFIPFIFIYSPALTMQGSPAEIIYAFISCLAGVFFISSGLEGYVYKLERINLFFRIIFISSGILISLPLNKLKLLGLLLILLSLVVLRISKKKSVQTAVN